jgi:hypothetical protein
MPEIHDLHEAAEILFMTARSYGSGNTTSGDVLAASYRFVATKIRSRGYADLARELERYAELAEKG